MARGNGKTPLAAVIALMLFGADYPIEPRAEVVCVATKKQQARFLFDEAKRQLKTCPGFKSVVKELESSLILPANDSTFYPLGSDSDTQDGFVLHGAILDELHGWRERHRGLYDKISTAFGKREQPLKVTITTAGDDKSVLWKEAYELSVKVVTGVFDNDAHFSLIYEIDDDDDDIHDPTAWLKANPNWGITVRPEFVKNMSNEAKILPTKALTLKRYHCNKLTESISKAIPLEIWRKGGRPLRRNLLGKRCHGGLDLGWRDDLASFYLVFPHTKSTRFDILGWSWIPSESERNLHDEPFRTWVTDDILQTTDGDTTDDKAILEKIKDCQKIYDLQSIALDPNNARSFSNVLINDLGIETFEHFQKRNTQSRITSLKRS